jgi:hypothetical protein
MQQFFKLITVVIIITALSTSHAAGQAEEKPSGKLSGLFFMDYFYNVMRDTGIAALPNTVLNGPGDVHGLQIRRVYFTYDFRYNSRLSSKFRLESDEANFTSSLSGKDAKKFGVFIKDAYVRFNYWRNQDIYAGIQGTPGFEVSERIWENRYIEKTIMDLRGACPSRDMGISFRGNIDTAGIFKYWFMIANGNAGLPEADKYKRFYGHVEITPLKNLSITIYADYQSKAPANDIFNPGEKIKNSIMTTSLFIGYRKRNSFSAGLEAYYRTTENGFKLTNNYSVKQETGISVFSTLYFLKKWNVYARYDLLEPNLHSQSHGDTRNLFMGGLAYKPNNNLIFSPNVFVETHEKTATRSIKNSVTSRITVSWSF